MKTKKKKGAETCRLPILNASGDALARKPKIQRKLWKAFKASCRKRRITPEAGVRMLLLTRMGIAAGMPHSWSRSNVSVGLEFSRDDDLRFIDVMMQYARLVRRYRSDQTGITAGKIERALFQALEQLSS
jgi:hypothetical protein